MRVGGNPGQRVTLPPVLMMWCPDQMKLMPFIMELSTRLGWESEKLTEDRSKNVSKVFLGSTC